MILCSCAVTLTYYAIDKERDHRPAPGPAKERVNELECWCFPSFEEGWPRRSSKITLPKLGAAGVALSEISDEKKLHDDSSLFYSRSV